MEDFLILIILNLWKKEKLKRKHIFGAILMVIGALLVLFPGQFQVKEGDLIILLATTLPPFGNYYQQRARKKVSSTVIMFYRSFLSSIFLFALASIFEVRPSTSALMESGIFILVNGIFLMGLIKILWLEGIHRIPITKAISLTAIAPAFTLLFAYFILGEIPTIWQLSGFLPMFIGIFLITAYKFNNIRS